mmetsp:Transcript_18772/g.28882  ORF Transcript_18772/g.28882 Transcript_18772/m.28882 type:complete len:94 (+) Transcript_18772:913-1194(+)
MNQVIAAPNEAAGKLSSHFQSWYSKEDLKKSKGPEKRMKSVEESDEHEEELPDFMQGSRHQKKNSGSSSEQNIMNLLQQYHKEQDQQAQNSVA